MTYNADVHRRRSIRLSSFDYTRAGAYYVTICTHQRACLFGSVTEKKVHLNEFGLIVQKTWLELPDHFRHVELDHYVVMPNHLHGILVLHDNPPVRVGPTAQSIGVMVGSFKSAASKRVNIYRGIPGQSIWQRNYYEHIIRDERDLAAVRQYIIVNPAKWSDDEKQPYQ